MGMQIMCHYSHPHCCFRQQAQAYLRTESVCHTDDPATDYWAVREELRMYNPEYCARPHVVALNKMDLQEAAHLQEEIAAEVLTMAHRIQVCHVNAQTQL